MAEKEFTMKQWALAYAKKGLAVFPVCAWGNSATDFKKPLTPRGCNDATTDTKQIIAWWEKYPTANIGLAMGLISGGAFAIDLDVKEEQGIDGRQSLREWERERKKLPDDTWLSITGNGGYHILYWTLREPVGCRTHILEGVDVRGEGGYIVAPPSLHFSGKHYEWEQSPEEFTFMEAPDIVLEFVNQNQKPEVGSAGFSVPVEIVEGNRTTTLFKLVCSLHAKGLTDEAVKAAVQVENERRCYPPLTDKELEKEVFPALRRYEKGTADYSRRENWNVQPMVKKTKTLESITAKELQGLNLPPLEFIVERFLPLGLALLGAPAKSFKSYMCLDMCICICEGLDFLGFKTKKYSCLYMDLESTRRRPKSRIEQILKGKEAPDNLHIVVDALPIGAGFEDQVREKIKEFPDIKVVIVDVFKKIRPSAMKSKDPYERDYEDYGNVKVLADELEIVILLVTHTTKMKHPDDPFNELTGSAGVMGSIDVAMVIKKESRDDKTAKLYITGRDLEEQCYEIEFNKNDFRWNKLGTHKDMEMLRLEYEYRNSPVIQTIKKLVEQNNGKWSGTASDIVSASKYFKGMQIYDDVRKVGQKITEFAQWLDKWDFIEFHKNPTKKTNEYLFVKNNSFDDLSEPSDLSADRC